MGGAPYAVIATIRDVLLLFYACRVFLSAGGNNFTESQFEQTTGAPAKVLFLYSVLWFFALFSAILVEGFL
ncbi:hypothetical protein WH297_25115 [Ochrobactrum vermis]|uniref:Uncharacterized protein n=1 Tax=Ochrobactrum vermis TaxID=1827297 RepID=A0ABU8PLQ5_9HYPH|nr:hypothetical protein [Ochrobactrum vermis]PQZ24374.1 hypothetical protein CQZ93_25435 [Ochrobactrum vermis]